MLNAIYAITKNKGKLILSDFHPFRKINHFNQTLAVVSQTEGDYFDTKLHSGNVAYQSSFDESEQEKFPKCQLRFYNLSEIINAVIKSDFIIKEFNEHPNWDDNKLPGEFTVIAEKN